MKITICFLGPDGSGKTTLALATYRWLNSKGLNCNYYHFSNITIAVLRHKRIANGFKIIMSFFDGILESAIVRLLKGIVITDRYPYDHFVYYHRIWPKWLQRIFMSMIPQPDLIFVLHAKPEIATSRKKDLSRSEYSKLESLYLELVNYFPADAVIHFIDTSANVEQVSAQIISKMRAHMPIL